ncbi:MAG: ATP-binding protein, partial [Propionibacteriaceae bacterium]|nr:ATP-binding protein [Propionibacteriaceae bacterium]
MGYRRRVVDTTLDEVQPDLAAVSLYGPKGVGKTATAQRRAASSLRLDLTDDVERLLADPGLLRTLPAPLLIDEWQRVPQVWDWIRREVDATSAAGRFLITGSSAPRGAAIHSGAGRIVGFRVRPLSLAEREGARPSVSLSKMLSGNASIEGETDVVLENYVTEIVGSGFPGIRNSSSERVQRALLDTYIDNVVQREFAEQGFPVRKPETLRAWLAGYAAATASTAKYVEILDAATSNQSDKPAKTTTMIYRQALEGLWLLDPTPAWLPRASFLAQLGQAAKHHLADTALAARLLNLDAASLMGGHYNQTSLGRGTILGMLFESLADLSVKVYAQAAEASVYHLRDRNGRHEIDLIVEGLGGRVVAFEVKLAATLPSGSGENLHWLKRVLGA